LTAPARAGGHLAAHWSPLRLDRHFADFRLLMARHPGLAGTIDAEATRRALGNS
jgi:hypothetical protein